MGKTEFFDDALFARVAAEARLSPRRRMNYNFHRSTDDAVNRLLNAMHRGSYLPVHRHLSPSRSESCVVLRGSVGVTIYDDAGGVVTVPTGRAAASISRLAYGTAWWCWRMIRCYLR